MIYRKFYKSDHGTRGIVFIDILIAFSIATLFIAAITEVSSSSRDVFEYARERNDLLDIYETHAPEIQSLLSQESYSAPQIHAEAFKYGNDRVVIVTEVVSVGSSATSTSKYFQSLKFIEVKSGPNASNKISSAPLCTPEYSNNDIVGSYEYLKGLTGSYWPRSTSSSSLKISATRINLPIPNISLTDLEVRNGIAYISANSPVQADADIFEVDISDRSYPQFLASLNTGPGIEAISVADGKIYAGAESTAGQLHIIDVNGTSTLTLIKKYRLPLPFATATPPIASSIDYDRGYVLLGTERWDGDEFNIIDVNDPTNPSKVSGIELGSMVTDILLNEDKAFVSTAGDKQLAIVNLRDNFHPTISSSFSPSGWQRQEGKRVELFEDTLNFARTSGGYNVVADKEIFSWSATSSDPSSGKALDIPGGVYGIVSDKDLIYLITRTAGKEFLVMDHDLNIIASTSLATNPQILKCDGNRLYVLSHDSPSIYEINIERL